MVKEWKSCFLWLWLYYFSTLLRVVWHWSNVLERQGDLTPPSQKKKKNLLIVAYKTALWCMNNYVMLFLLCQICMQENCAWTITTFFFFCPKVLCQDTEILYFLFILHFCFEILVFNFDSSDHPSDVYLMWNFFLDSSNCVLVLLFVVECFVWFSLC